MTKINEFQQGMKIEGFYIIKSINLKTASNNKKYLDLVLGDKTGEISSKIWDLGQDEENLYKSNEVIKARGTCLEWQGGLQLKIEKIRKAQDSDNVNIDELVECAPFTKEEMFSTLQNYVDEVKNDDIKKILNKIISDNSEKLGYYPAAKKNHHSIKGGLLYHIVTMLKLSDKICEVYTYLNKDLIYAGIILHDLAKIEEMISSEIGIVDDYSVEGTLLGHITEGIKNVELIGRELNVDKEVLMLLEHLILSHHYEPEFGSPVKPMFPEAEILHYIDIIDSRMYDMHKLSNGINPGEFSERLWSLENRRVYKPKL